MADLMVMVVGMDPFLIFPEEVWELLLDKVDDAQDAWNLLKAFPQLDANVALQKRKHFWLFGLIVPHLIPWRESRWIKENDLLNCRQVCRKWSAAVDGFLESQPQLQAYHPEAHGQVAQLVGVGPGRFHWNVKGYRKQEEDKVHFGGTRFSITDYYYSPEPEALPLRRFLRELEAHPPGRSPFLSRALSISTWLEDDYFEREKNIEFAEDALELHTKFGEHVWFYKVDFRWRSLGARCMIQNIRFLPNLKLLDIVVDDTTCPPSDAKKFLGQLEKGLPALPSLEALRIGECPPLVTHFLISRFAAQIRRLNLHLKFWRDEYSTLFPNLTEFDISDWRLEPDGDRLKHVLLSLEAPQLAKLQVKFPFLFKELPGKFVIEDDVFQWLKRFPNLKFLGLGSGCRFVNFIEKGIFDPANDTFSSLQFLAIRTSFEMSYNFLRCLPSLQHLQLHVSPKPFVIDLSTDPSVKIREEIQTASMYKSNIWELLPKLKTVTLLMDKWDRERKMSNAFNREGYEFERRFNNGPAAVGRGGEDDGLAPLRKDIIDFLQDPEGNRRDEEDEVDEDDDDNEEIEN